MTCRYNGTYTMHAYGSERAYVNNFLVEDSIFYEKGPFLIGGGRPSKDIRVFRNYLHNVSMRIGYNAPHNENCDVRDNIIVNGDLNFIRYKDVKAEGNLVVKKGQKRPGGAKAVLLPNRFDRNRAHLVIYNWDKAETVEVSAKGFLKNGETFRLMDPKDMFGRGVMQGECDAERIRIPVKDEFAVFVVLKDD